METLTKTEAKISTRTKIVVTVAALAAIGGIAAGLIPMINQKLPNLQYAAQNTSLNNDGSVNVSYTIRNAGVAPVNGTFDVQFTYLRTESATISTNQAGTLNNYVSRVRASGPQAIPVNGTYVINAVIPADMMKRAGQAQWLVYIDISNRIRESNESDNISSLMMPQPPVYPRGLLNINALPNNPGTITSKPSTKTLLLSFSVEGKNVDMAISTINAVIGSCVTDIQVKGPTGTLYGSVKTAVSQNFTQIPLSHFVLKQNTAPQFFITGNTVGCATRNGSLLNNQLTHVIPVYPYGFDVNMGNVASLITIKR